jgi:hypothetical protein
MIKESYTSTVKAILRINPDAKVIVSTPLDGSAETIEWVEGTAEISKADIDAKKAELEIEWTAQEYARNRQAEYPDWGVQLNKIYDDGLTKWKSETVDPVKAKWPKDNSGPK